MAAVHIRTIRPCKHVTMSAWIECRNGAAARGVPLKIFFDHIPVRGGDES